MNLFQKAALVSLRVSLGWLMFYAGFTKILDPEWSAAGFLNGAQTFPEFYAWFAQPQMLPYTDLLNEWGLTIVGAMLILGIGVRLASVLGVAFMALYYFPTLQVPYAGEHGFIVDDHLVYALAFLVLAALRAGHIWGLEKWCLSLPICSRFPALRAFFG